MDPGVLEDAASGAGDDSCRVPAAAAGELVSPRRVLDRRPALRTAQDHDPARPGTAATRRERGCPDGVDT